MIQSNVALGSGQSLSEPFIRRSIFRIDINREAEYLGWETNAVPPNYISKRGVDSTFLINLVESRLPVACGIAATNQ